MKLKTALIGCGAIAEQLHLPVLAGHPEIDLVAIVDPNLERARYFAKGYNVPYVFQDISELDFSQIDAVVIATPPFHHAPCAIELIEKGLHVLVEKPLALSYEDANKVVSLAEKNNIKIAVPLYRRLFPSFRLLVSLVKRNFFGPPQAFSVIGGGFYNWPAASLGNLKKELAGGGVLMDLGPHFLDFLFQLFGEPAELLEYQHDALGGIEADCILKLKFYHQGQPLEGTVELARTRKLKGGVCIHCERAILEFKPSERFKVFVYPKGSSNLEDPWDSAPKSLVYQTLWRNISEEESWYATFARIYDDWLDAIKKDREPVLSGKSTLPIIRLIEECYSKAKPLKQSWVKPPKRDSRQTIHFKRKPKVLITGATGFIGCRVAEILHLREGWDVRAVVRNPGKAARLARLDVEMVSFDLEQDRGFEELVEGCDAVIHCAVGTAYGEPKKIYRVTVEGTRRLARAALKKGVQRFIHVSSMAVYGSKVKGLIDESFPVRPDPGSIYGETKAQAERVVKYYVKKGLPAIIFRPARVFGPFGFTFVINPLRALVEDRFAWRGDPNTPCDMIYVDNVVEAFISALYSDFENLGGEIFNLGEQDSMTWQEFYGRFVEALGLNVNLDSIPIADSREEKDQNILLKSVHSLKEILTSPEFKVFVKKVIYTDPIGSLARKIMEMPKVEFLLKKIFISQGLPIYLATERTREKVVLGGGTNIILKIDKLKNLLGYSIACTKDEAITRTSDWLQFARILNK